MLIRKSSRSNGNVIIIFGSSRSDGNTKRAINAFDPENKAALVDLNDVKISPFDYEHKNFEDDYIDLMEKIIKYEHIVLATPVYWYTMSAQIKIFVDRLSDLLTIRKDLGKKLSGKKLSVLASYSTSLPEGFELAFSQTCNYMDMKYIGCFFHYAGDDKKLLLNNYAISGFRKNILEY
ncbi:MAG: hypothetical protein Tsb0015_06060 [Simkaniaceae bacterium]